MTFSRTRLIPYALVLLSLVPVVAGAWRVSQLAIGAEVTDGNARFFDSPAPVLAHIVGATVFCLVGAFQFDHGLRRARPRWHRAAGRAVVLSGLVVAASGIWMTLFYKLPPLDDSALLNGVRLFFATAMGVALVLAVAAILRRKVATHRAWMMRAYAIGVAAGTQAFTHLPLALQGGPVTELGRTAAMTAGWLINLAVAEWLIRRPARRRPPRTGAAGAVVAQEQLRGAGSMG